MPPIQPQCKIPQVRTIDHFFYTNHLPLTVFGTDVSKKTKKSTGSSIKWIARVRASIVNENTDPKPSKKQTYATASRITAKRPTPSIPIACFRLTRCDKSLDSINWSQPADVKPTEAKDKKLPKLKSTEDVYLAKNLAWKCIEDATNRDLLCLPSSYAAQSLYSSCPTPVVSPSRSPLAISVTMSSTELQAAIQDLEKASSVQEKAPKLEAHKVNAARPSSLTAIPKYKPVHRKSTRLSPIKEQVPQKKRSKSMLVLRTWESMEDFVNPQDVLQEVVKHGGQDLTKQNDTLMSDCIQILKTNER